MKAKYINPYTDFGFKKLFGEEGSKDLLKDFLNELLPEKHQIKTLTFKNVEQQGNIAIQRKAIFDIFCKNESGDQFIVEMQKAKINFFKERTIFYSTFPIKEQAEKGGWDFQLSAVYCIAILDFIFDDQREQKHHLNHIQLKDQYCQLFYDKLQYIFIEMPRFNKKESELITHFEKWLYFLKHLPNFNHIPQILNEPVFIKAFHTAEIANYSKAELDQYEESLKVYRDLKGVIDTAYFDGLKEGEKKGKKEGKEEGIQVIVLNMVKKGYNDDLICELTGISSEEIDQFKESN